MFFRDTAHGFITWALATVVGAAVLASAVGTVSEKGIQAAASASSGVAASGVAASVSQAVTPYDIDRLLRSPGGEKEGSQAEGKAQVTRILTKTVSTGDVPSDDRDYLAELVAARAGISETDAQKRVDDSIAAVRQAADEARKAAASTSIFMGLSMIIGAFIASVAAALGGRLRDQHP